MKKKSRALTWIISIVILFASVSIIQMLLTFSGGDPWGEWALVTRVVDGDTIYVGRGWRRTKVRLIGVDTPEIYNFRKPAQFMGMESREFAEKSLKKQKVHLVLEPPQLYDRYDRLLAYVYLPDGTLFNARLVKKGYARVLAPTPFRYYSQFVAYEREAKAAHLGIWSKGDKAPPRTHKSNK